MAVDSIGGRLTNEQAQLVAAIRRFGEREVLPFQRALPYDADKWGELLRRCGELGFLAIGDPSVHVDNRFTTLGLVAEELARFDMSLSTSLASSGLRAQMVRQVADEVLSHRVSSGSADGSMLVAIGLTEPDAGSDAGALRATAELVGDEYLLNGEKNSVSGVSFADYVVDFARDIACQGRISAFLVDRKTQGLTWGVYRDLGWAPRGRGWMHLNDVGVPAGCLIGEPGRGLQLVLAAFDFNRAIIGLICIGAAMASIAEVSEYVKQRKTFGSPLATRQAIAFPLVDLWTRLSAARLLCIETLQLADEGHRHKRESAMAKGWVPALCAEAQHRCLLTYGHMGFSDELPVERRLRDTIGFEIGDGTLEMMNLILSREMFGRDVVG